MQNINAVVYARYSSHSQTEQSIEGQLSAAYKYAKAKGYTIIQEYCDRAKTGTNDNRAEFQRMLSDTAKRTFTVIIVWKVDRFGRNREEIAFNKYKCKKNGVRVEYVAENISEGPEGVILEAVLEGMAEYYSLQLSQNIRRGMLETAKKHHIIGNNIPLGYVAGPNREYVIDEHEAKVVKLIYEKYIDGYSISELTNYLNERGYQTKYKRPFTKNSVPRILHNEMYTGLYKFKDIRDEDAIPAIIPKEMYRKVQKLMEIRKRKPSSRWSYTDFILSDKLYCGNCGTKMLGKSGYGKSGRKYNYYVCSKKDKRPVRQDWLEPLVIRELKNIISDPETREYIADLVWDYYQKNDESKAELENIQRQIEEMERSTANLVKSVEDGMPYNLVKDRLTELQDNRTALEKIKGEIIISENLKISKDHIRYFLEQFLDFDYEDRHCQKKLIEVLVQAIYLYDDHYVLLLNYGDETRTYSLKNIKLADIEESVRPCLLKWSWRYSRRTLILNGYLLVIVRMEKK